MPSSWFRSQRYRFRGEGGQQLVPVVGTLVSRPCGELIGFSHSDTAVLMTIFWVASSLSGLLGSKLGDVLAIRYHKAVELLVVLVLATPGGDVGMLLVVVPRRPPRRGAGRRRRVAPAWDLRIEAWSSSQADMVVSDRCTMQGGWVGRTTGSYG